MFQWAAVEEEITWGIMLVTGTMVGAWEEEGEEEDTTTSTNIIPGVA